MIAMIAPSLSHSRAISWPLLRHELSMGDTPHINKDSNMLVFTSFQREPLRGGCGGTGAAGRVRRGGCGGAGAAGRVRWGVSDRWTVRLSGRPSVPFSVTTRGEGKARQHKENPRPTFLPGFNTMRCNTPYTASGNDCSRSQAHSGSPKPQNSPGSVGIFRQLRSLPTAAGHFLE